MSFDPHNAFTVISKGNESARQFCVVMYEFFHLIDDLVDGDKRGPESVAIVVFALIDTVANNPFFQEHKQKLLPVIQSGAVAWAGSEELRRRDDVKDKLAAEVLKSWYQELFYAVAGIVGGLPHAMACSRQFRGYDFG